MSAVYADIKKYKLASSEGINKVANRTIRFRGTEGSNKIRSKYT